MTLTKDVTLNKIQEILEVINEVSLKDGRFYSDKLDEATFATLSLLNHLYGESSEFKNQILISKGYYLKGGNSKDYSPPLINTLKGILNALKFEIENSLIESLDSQAKGEILGDFLSLAKNLLNEGFKDPAAVLACGALEDTLKKFGDKKGLNVCDMELSAVINLLKTHGHIKGAQSGVVQSYVQLRNKAFHAQFDKIAIPEVSSLISFVEQFLITNF